MTQNFDLAPTVELLVSFLPQKALLSETDNFKKALRIYLILRCLYGDGISCHKIQIKLTSGFPQSCYDPTHQKDVFDPSDFYTELEITGELSQTLTPEKPDFKSQTRRQQRATIKNHNLAILRQIPAHSILWYLERLSFRSDCQFAPYILE
jgi:hypothetical protein